jgi:two-component system nitrogen regulation response regulator NtrX
MSSGRLILVVDDETDVRETTRELLELHGYAVEEARTGREALADLRRSRPALLVTDVIMPDMDGLELIRTVRREHPETPIIVVTGSEIGRPGTLAAMAVHMGARHVFAKPVPVEAFLAAVARLVPPSVA